MLSIIALFRNTRELAAQCLASLLRTEQALHLDATALEYVLIDDCSDDAAGMSALLAQFRDATRAPTRIIRFREHRHYAYGLAMGMSLARGECVLFVSHDMMAPAPCVRTLLEVAGKGGDIVRPRSQHMDGAKQLQLSPPLPLRGDRDVDAFSALVRRRFGDAAAASGMLIGDAMLIKRSVIERIGVLDTGFGGFMADIDFGVRARRAGFNVLTAMGAWLHHVGGGAAKDAIQRGAQRRTVDEKNVADMVAAYEKFRAKWDGANLPADFLTIRTSSELTVLQHLPPGRYDDPPPKLQLDPAACEIV